MAPHADIPGIMAAVERAFEHTRDGRWAALLLIDLQDLHAINSSYGFDAGDAVLDAIGERLDGLCQAPAWWGYRGMGQFTLVLPELTAPGLAEVAAQRVAARLGTNLRWQDGEITPRVRLGIATATATVDPGEGSTGLLLEAEQALYHARRHQLDHWLFDRERAASVPDFRLRQDFLAALSQNELMLYYQPKLHLRSNTVGCAEGLLRWRHPAQGMVSPELLVAMAEHAGRGMELTRWVLQTALRESRGWPVDQRLRNVAINLSASVVDSPELVSMVRQALEIWGVNPSELTLEITEQAVVQNKSSGFDNLSALRGLGVRIAIDDFGTGYSSLAYFKDIPADELKVDKSFVLQWRDDPVSRKIVRLIIDMARAFELSVVAEGIEDAEAMGALAALECDFGQGYHISRPVPQAELCAWLRENTP